MAKKTSRVSSEKEEWDMKKMRAKMMKKMSLFLIVFGILWLLAAVDIMPEWVLGAIIIIMGLKMIIWQES
ncbi:MAG TPA: hypothetical protein VI894_01060 [Candidatus Nanoarchaeia archaeon]|nr:hypothetical protein [Candidatus Nanoarchaeia archaeon]